MAGREQIELINDLNTVAAGGSTSADLLQVLEEYLPVLLGMVKEGNSCIHIIHLSLDVIKQICVNSCSPLFA